MKILMINKFLYPKGGSETYMLGLGDHLTSQEHEVQYFGMDTPERIVGNRIRSYTSGMDFHNGSFLLKLTYPLRTIYSSEARRKLRAVLDDMQPDVCHLNNFNYQLTPSIILEIKKWSKRTGHPCRIVYTAHDYQLVCPNHMCFEPNSCEICEKCLGGHYINCVKGRCIHGSAAKSIVGAMEAVLWRAIGVYRCIDSVICCSGFIKTKLDTDPVLAERTVVLHNFAGRSEEIAAEKKDHVLYFGRYSKEKGIETLVKAARSLPHIQFIFAGAGPMESLLDDEPNIINVGFQSGEELIKLISQARLTVCPSEWYENCPYSVMESEIYGTPVIGADIGGIPELIQPGVTGELFESGNAEQLAQKIEQMWNNERENAHYSSNCGKAAHIMPVSEYYEELMKIYG